VYAEPACKADRSDPELLPKFGVSLHFRFAVPLHFRFCLFSRFRTTLKSLVRGASSQDVPADSSRSAKFRLSSHFRHSRHSGSAQSASNPVRNAWFNEAANGSICLSRSSTKLLMVLSRWLKAEQCCLANSAPFPISGHSQTQQTKQIKKYTTNQNIYYQ
jgi:hypothetical protein